MQISTGYGLQFYKTPLNYYIIIKYIVYTLLVKSLVPERLIFYDPGPQNQS